MKLHSIAMPVIYHIQRDGAAKMQRTWPGGRKRKNGSGVCACLHPSNVNLLFTRRKWNEWRAEKKINEKAATDGDDDK